MNYDERLVTLEDMSVSYSFTRTEEEALEEAKDALAFAQSLNTALISIGARLPEDPDLDGMENFLDSVVCELGAAVMLLCQFAGVEDRLRTIQKELYEANKSEGGTVDPQLINAYGKLADRISKSRIKLDTLSA